MPKREESKRKNKNQWRLRKFKRSTQTFYSTFNPALNSFQFPPPLTEIAKSHGNPQAVLERERDQPSSSAFISLTKFMYSSNVLHE